MPEPSPTNTASAPQDSPSPTHSRDPFRCTVKRSSQQPTNSSPDSQQHRAGMSTLDTQRASERPHRTVIASGQVTTIVADRLPEPKPELLHKRPVIMDASPQAAACVPNLNHATRVGSGKRPAPSPDRSSFDIFPNDVVAANAAAASPQHHRGEGRAGSITGNTKRAPSHTTVTYEAQIQRRVQKESEQLGFGHKASSTRDPHYQVQAPFARDGDE